MTDDTSDASGDGGDRSEIDTSEPEEVDPESPGTKSDTTEPTGTSMTYGDVDATESQTPESASETSPMGDLADELSPGSDGAEVQALFDEMDVATLDGERVWAQLEAADDPPTGEIHEREIRDIDKRRYCHQCVHFADPPAVRCEHEGTSILELVDVQTVKVANCPVVLEEESIEDR
ncbi:hypothetical protein Halru_2011 [Halovivax ruber XH-70]|uniref:DUF8135 domain-containing protein n=1 Tax=Halovivax ruber (strain DSM 18193 / JCM 13892 / XH-70) TaxID=797302 RepID=L0IAI2_HALRX|nr:hypothetical protein [Halovivax ruber]AGB16605.1 hypothetical protein Halru_2011 [Halovivax ruber XH-70]